MELSNGEPKPQSITFLMRGPNAVLVREACERLQMKPYMFVRRAVLRELKAMGYVVVD